MHALHQTITENVAPIPALQFRWLQAATGGTIVFGLALAAFGPGVQPYLTLAHGVMGSVMVGWFVPDTTMSLWTGLWPNAVLNMVFGLAFAVPLIATRGCFRGR